MNEVAPEAAKWEALASRPRPEWYDDAKLGIFVHWGLYSVPAWAPRVSDIQDLLATRGPRAMLRENPYAEWYLNTMQVEGSPTQVHHRATYGDRPYDSFVAPFDEATGTADLDALAGVCQQAGARYVVLTTKHHDGFTLWPSALPHPVKGRYHARRDLVGELTEAVRRAGMRMGLYYSGGYDWPYNGAVLANPADALLAMPATTAYRDYATAHVRELVDRYAPSVLWNDIGWPPGAGLPDLFAYYYDQVTDGVVNDRWAQLGRHRSDVFDAVARGVGDLVQALWRFVPRQHRSLTFPTSPHFDFSTPEYASFDEIAVGKWESTRGVGHSFAANRNEDPDDIVTTTELVRSFCDIVSKNGNLLLGIGPEADGTVAEAQLVPLRGLGSWLAANGEAIYGTRPWDVAAGTTSEGTEVRFTQRDGTLFAMLVEAPGSPTFSLRGVDARHVHEVALLGVDEAIDWSVDGDRLTVSLPARLPISPVHTLRLGPGARAVSG